MTEFSEEIEVVAGSPTPEELAVIIALLEEVHAQEASSEGGKEVKTESSWSRNVDRLRKPLAPGAGQWLGAFRNGLN